MADQPNILHVFADQMRALALGCMGGERVQTPHLDRPAAQGTLFTNAFANTPVCTPSRGSLLTGRYAWSCRCIVNNLRLPKDRRRNRVSAPETRFLGLSTSCSRNFRIARSD